ncbi:hypothetical protein C5D25_17755 [Rathayibacter sp. AY1D7]|nr:hypothetical protein C5C52_15845 [Rathayibacter sp. AY1E5]PPH50794.1 hypothetical protein C5D25_17755 [Rathayibacter sp. AY1D7]
MARIPGPRGVPPVRHRGLERRAPPRPRGRRGPRRRRRGRRRVAGRPPQPLTRRPSRPSATGARSATAAWSPHPLERCSPAPG